MKHTTPAWVAAALLAPLAGCAGTPPGVAADPNQGTQVLVPTPSGRPSLLLFTRTAAFRHDSIPGGIHAVQELATAANFGLTATEDAKEFSDAKLAPFAAVVFLSTTGDVLNEEQQAAFERYIGAGHGFVGVHAAADCEYDWPWYGALVGAYFTGHSDVLSANVKLEQVAHPALSGLPAPWTRKDEWYGFRSNPRGQVTVLLTVDETTFDAGPSSMGADHPVAWFHDYAGGRAFYTALGHTPASYGEPEFLAHLQGGLTWAAGVSP